MSQLKMTETFQRKNLGHKTTDSLLEYIRGCKNH